MVASRSSPWRIFGIWACIICVLLGTYHLIHFINPLLGLGSAFNETGNRTNSTSFPSNGDDLSPDEFADMVIYYQDYDWESYDVNDFPDWLYMPSNYTYSNDSSSPQPFQGYDWDTYDVNDFPSWMIMPSTLPADFNPDEFEFMDYMDEDYKSQVMVAMSSSTSEGVSDSDLALLQILLGQSDSGSSFDMSQIFGLLAGSDLIRSILFFVAGLILFILLRTTH